MYFDRFWLKPFEGAQFKNGLKPVPIDVFCVVIKRFNELLEMLFHSIEMGFSPFK